MGIDVARDALSDADKSVTGANDLIKLRNQNFFLLQQKSAQIWNKKR